MKDRSVHVHEDYIAIYRRRAAPAWHPRLYKRTAARERRLMGVLGETIRPGARKAWRWSWHEWLASTKEAR